MAPSKVMHGARAQLIIADPNTGKSGVVGIFTSVSYGLALDVQEVPLLGRYSPDELVYTASEAVNVTASGFRVVDAGPHAVAAVPELSTLMQHEYISLAIYDRQTNKLVARIENCRPTGYSTTINARQLEEVTVTFRGLLVHDETVTNSESPGASTLP
jgi:hypothetical protein